MSEQPTTLLQTLLTDSRKVLHLYALGAVLFFVGAAIVMWADYAIAASLTQELAVLAGLFSGGVGFIIAMASQCLLIAQRFHNMGKRP